MDMLEDEYAKSMEEKLPTIDEVRQAIAPDLEAVERGKPSRLTVKADEKEFWEWYEKNIGPKGSI